MGIYYCNKGRREARIIFETKNYLQGDGRKKYLNNWKTQKIFIDLLLLLSCFYVPDFANGFLVQDKDSAGRSVADAMENLREIRNTANKKFINDKEGSAIAEPPNHSRDEAFSTNDKVELDSDSMDALIAKRRGSNQPIKDTSVFRIGRDSQGTQEEGNIKSITGPDYLNKVIVFQKPFHFHIPILSRENSEPLQQTIKPTEETTTEHSNKLQDPKNNLKATTLPKRDIQNTVQSSSTTASVVVDVYSTEKHHHEEELERLLRQHPKLIPSDNRKRNSGNNHSHHDHEHLEEEAHRLIGVHLGESAEEDLVEQTDTHLSLRKRYVKPTLFSQNIVDSILGHQDDLVKYREKIMERSKTLGIKPEAVFNATVYGSTSVNKSAPQNKTNDIYQSRLQFHELFLDDSSESEKYHYNEILDQDKQLPRKERGPFSAYMGILKRSKRGIKSWFKKLIGKKDKTTTTTTTTTKSPKNKSNANKTKQGKVRLYEQKVDENGDSAVDLLLPTALRRSSYLKRRNEINGLEKEEKEFEEEYEKSEEIEPKVREEGGNEDPSGSGSASGEGSVEKEGKKKKKSKNDKKISSKLDRNKRSIVDDTVSPLGGKEILTISKDEMLLVIEMIFNLVQFQCTNISTRLMEGVLSMTQFMVGWSALPDYIVERREAVDQIFSQMLDCSTNSKPRPRTRKLDSNTRKEKKLRRSKRVRRGENTTTVEEVKNLQTNDASEDNMEEIKTEKRGNIFVVQAVEQFIKVHLRFHDLILDTCFNVDKQLLLDLYLVFIEEMSEIQRNEDFKEKIEKFLRQNDIDIHQVYPLITECYNEGKL